MLFAAWSLGSEHWALPLGLALGFFLLVSLGIPSSSGSGTLRVRLVFQALVVPLGFLVVANATSLYATFFSPFVASINVVLLFLLRRHLSPPRRSLVWILVFISSIVMTTGLTWWIGPGQSGWILSVLILVIAVGGLMGGFLHPAKDRSKLHWGQLATIAGCGLVMLYLQWLSLPAWMPQEAFPASWP
jgi:hypothetical protein